MESSEVYAGAAMLGAVTGMRSMAGPAILVRISRTGAFDGSNGPFGFLTHSGFLPTTSILALGELVVDKLPFAPNRTAVGPLLGRAVIGALTGAAIASGKKRSLWAGALIGTAAAVGAAYAAYHLRRGIKEKIHLPDPLIALAEDAIVGGLGALISSRFDSPALG